MKRAAIFLALVVSLVLPVCSHAQYGTIAEEDRLNPYQYQDVDDGQFLKFASYVLTPIGMGLEWGIMRPLHYAATQTPLAPVLSGDKEHTQFGQNNNADFVPPGTFGPPPLVFSNEIVPSPPERPATTTSLVEQSVPPSIPQGSQPALR